MPNDARKMSLGLFLMPAGHHVAAWRHPDTAADAGFRLDFYKHITRRAEAAKFDFVFLADNSGVREADPLIQSRSVETANFEPLTLLSALATVTERIGLIATVSTSFNAPYHTARQFASLDLLSNGRSGWNLVTSATDQEARNFGLDQHMPHSDRYDRAAEYADVVRGLWDTFEDDSFLFDKAGGHLCDPDKIHVLNHNGPYFRVRGPLNVGRSPQGQPVLVQAGSSETGKELAAMTADVVFTAQQTTDQAVGFYSDVKRRMARYGRPQDQLKIMPGVMPVVGRTSQEADDKFETLQRLIHPDVGVALLSVVIGTDLRGLPIDGPLPELPVTNATVSRQKLLVDMARREKLTIRDLYLRTAAARGHWIVKGTPDQVADQLAERFLKHGSDGFNIMPTHFPGGLDDFIEMVLPELRRRGLFRHDYAGSTLREHLAIGRPGNRFGKLRSDVA